MVLLRQITKFLKRHAFAAVCVVLTIAIGVAFVIRMDLLSQAGVEIELRQQEAEGMKRNLRNASGLRDNLSALNEMLKNADARLVRAEDLASNLQYFYRLETDTGTKILLLRQMTGQATGAQPPAPSGAAKPTYRPVPYSVIVEGSFPQIMAFLTRLERGTHFNRTPVFTAQRGATDSPEGIRSGTVVVNLSIELMGAP